MSDSAEMDRMQWIDDFWENMPDLDNDQCVSTVRLLAELLAGGLFWRDGDELVGRNDYRVVLGADDQWLIRKIEEASSTGDGA